MNSDDGVSQRTTSTHGIGDDPRRCEICGNKFTEAEMEVVDVSKDDEYYPTFEYYCQGCYHDMESGPFEGL